MVISSWDPSTLQAAGLAAIFVSQLDVAGKSPVAAVENHRKMGWFFTAIFDSGYTCPTEMGYSVIAGCQAVSLIYVQHNLIYGDSWFLKKTELIGTQVELMEHMERPKESIFRLWNEWSSGGACRLELRKMEVPWLVSRSGGMMSSDSLVVAVFFVSLV